ncbi:MAG: C45 family autoproteolytic acyltransferase/hydrolase [Promethearchaeota archaeon]
MFELTLKGTHYEIGHHYGMLLRKWGINFPKPEIKSIKFAAMVEEEVRDLFPNLIEEIRGITDGGSFDYEVIRTYALTVGRSPGCTVFSISGQHTSDGKTVFARNYDASSAFQNFTLIKTYPKGCLSHIGCVFEMIVGREDGINEAGVAIAVTGVHGVYTDKPGVWDHIPIRIVLDTCTTTKEAVELLEKIPHLWTKNFLIADAQGDIAIVEAAQQDLAVIYPTDGIGVVTNHFVSDSMQNYSNQEKLMYKTKERLSNVRRWFENQNEKVDLDILKWVLSDPEMGVCSDFKAKQPNGSFLTVWSWVAKLGEKNLQLATGVPVSLESEYKNYIF